MSNNNDNNSDKPRVRAWFIIKVEPGTNAVEVAENIYNNLGGADHSEEFKNEFVLIRSDVVSGCTLGEIIAPVDAVILEPDDPEKILREVEGRIEALGGTAAIFKAVVSAHTPKPPHDAYSYVTAIEKEAGEKLGIRPEDIPYAGFQKPRSPGPNAWG
jgi:hypothetical protein